MKYSSTYIISVSLLSVYWFQSWSSAHEVLVSVTVQFSVTEIGMSVCFKLFSVELG